MIWLIAAWIVVLSVLIGESIRKDHAKGPR